jgi:hypothetical protein
MSNYVTLYSSLLDKKGNARKSDWLEFIHNDQCTHIEFIVQGVNYRFSDVSHLYTDESLMHDEIFDDNSLLVPVNL